MQDDHNYQDILTRLETLQGLLQQAEDGLQDDASHLRSPEKMAALVQVMQAYKTHITLFQTYGLAVSNPSFPLLEECLAKAR